MVAAAMMACALSAAGAGATHKKKTSSKVAAKKAPASANLRTASPAAGKRTSRTASRAASKSASQSATKPASKSTTKPYTRRLAASSRRGGKKPAAKQLTTWRNRQMAPTPDRYREIQEAMVAKGYLKPEDVSGGWDQNSMDALKKFQTAQNLDATGKINSLSLIALGLGPKRDTASVKPTADATPTNR
jgi:hypothetical protein